MGLGRHRALLPDARPAGALCARAWRHGGAKTPCATPLCCAVLCCAVKLATEPALPGALPCILAAPHPQAKRGPGRPLHAGGWQPHSCVRRHAVVHPLPLERLGLRSECCAVAGSAFQGCRWCACTDTCACACACACAVAAPTTQVQLARDQPLMLGRAAAATAEAAQRAQAAAAGAGQQQGANSSVIVAAHGAALAAPPDAFPVMLSAAAVAGVHHFSGSWLGLDGSKSLSLRGEVVCASCT
jgi:hypothetical protein